MNDENKFIMPPRLYRFFKEEQYADAMVAGTFRISTLETCRRHEDPLQGDPHEATHVYRSGSIAGLGSDPDVAKIARQMGIEIRGPNVHLTIEGNTYTQSMSDAYVVCTTLAYSPDMLSETFGKYCVEILDSLAFLNALLSGLNEKNPINKIKVGEITYRDRLHTGLEDSPGVIGFVKPLKYQEQKEYRFIYSPLSADPIEPIVVSNPTLGKICKRIA